MKPWNLKQVPIDDREGFKTLLIEILEDGRKLTPFEVALVKQFLFS